MSSIAQTGFLMSLTSYVFFWLLDLVRPGFVARFFSVHIFLLGMIVFGIWWSHTIETYTDRIRLQYILSLVFGIVFLVIVWKTGVWLDFMRPMVAFIAFFVPLIVLRLVRYK
jgi:hypothetical protein